MNQSRRYTSILLGVWQKVDNNDKHFFRHDGPIKMFSNSFIISCNAAYSKYYDTNFLTLVSNLFSCNNSKCVSPSFVSYLICCLVILKFTTVFLKILTWYRLFPLLPLYLFYNRRESTLLNLLILFIITWGLTYI